MNVNLLLTLLKKSLGGPVKITDLSEKTQIPIDVIEQDLIGLVRAGLLSWSKGQKIELSKENRLNLALYSLKEGADIEETCRVLGWAEFEDLVGEVLVHHNYRTQKHFRFKGLKRRYEIDIIGLKEPLILSVECKRWHRSGRTAIIDVAKLQLDRTSSLAHYLPEPKDRLSIANWKETEFLPLVTTLSNAPLKIFNGVPIIPIFHLNNFLNEFQGYKAELTCLHRNAIRDLK